MQKWGGEQEDKYYDHEHEYEQYDDKHEDEQYDDMNEDGDVGYASEKASRHNTDPMQM